MYFGYPRYPLLDASEVAVGRDTVVQVRQLVTDYYVSEEGHLSLDPDHMDLEGQRNVLGTVPYHPLSTDVFEVPVILHSFTRNGGVPVFTAERLTDLLEKVNQGFLNTIQLDVFAPKMPDVRFPSRTPVSGSRSVVLSLAKQLLLYHPDDLQQVQVGSTQYLALRLGRIYLQNVNTQNPMYVVDRPYYNTAGETLRVRNTTWTAVYLGITGGTAAKPQNHFTEGVLEGVAPDLSAGGLDLHYRWAVFTVRKEGTGAFVSREEFEAKLDVEYPMYFELDNTVTKATFPLDYLDFSHRVGQMNIKFVPDTATESISLEELYASNRNRVTVGGTDYLLLVRQGGITYDLNSLNPALAVSNGVCTYDFVLRPASNPNSSSNDLPWEGHEGTALSAHRVLVNNYRQTLFQLEGTEVPFLLDRLRVASTVNLFLLSGLDMGRTSNLGSLSSPPVDVLSRAVPLNHVYSTVHHGALLLDEEAALAAAGNVRGDSGQFAAPVVHGLGAFLGLLPTYGLRDASDQELLTTDLVLDTPLVQRRSKTSLDPLSPQYLQVDFAQAGRSSAGGIVIPMFMNYMDLGPTPIAFTHGQVFVARYFLARVLHAYVRAIREPEVSYYTNASGRVKMPVQWHTTESTTFVTPAVRNVQYDQLRLSYIVDVPEVKTELLNASLVAAGSAQLTRLDVTHLLIGGLPVENYLNDFVPGGSSGDGTGLTLAQMQSLQQAVQDIGSLDARLDLVEAFQTVQEDSTNPGFATDISALEARIVDVSQYVVDHVGGFLQDISDFQVQLDLLRTDLENQSIETTVDDVSRALFGYQQTTDASLEALRERIRDVSSNVSGALTHDVSADETVMNRVTVFPHSLVLLDTSLHRWVLDVSGSRFRISYNGRDMLYVDASGNR